MIFLKKALFKSADQNAVNFLVDETYTLKIWILEENIFRVGLFEKAWILDRTWSVAPGMDELPVEGRERSSVEGFSCPPFKVEQDKEFTEITSALLRLKVEHSPLRLKWFDQTSGEEIHRDRVEQAYAKTDKGWNHYSQRDEKDFYFGLGEKTGSLVRNERRFEMRNTDAMDYDPDLTDPLYKHIPFYICQKPKLAYGIFYDNLSSAILDMGGERENYYGFFSSYQASAGDLDFYFILGTKLKNVTQKFSWLTGKTFFAPLASLKYSGSTMSYTEGKNAQAAIVQFLKKCEEHDIPVGSFQLSSGYCMHGNLRQVFVWNKEKFPDFSELSSQAKKQKVEFSANIKPVMFDSHPEYDKSLLIQSGDKPERSYFWDGYASHFDFSQEKTRVWWKRKVTSELIEKGISSTWNDNNEFHIVDDKAELRGFKKAIPVTLARPVLSLLMCQSSYQAHLEHDRNKRPWLITRAGGPGLQRYAQTWTGDNRTSWRSLKMNLQTALGLSLSGIYNWGIDVGGFSGAVPEPELLLRWIQQGIFYPRFTIHSWKSDGTVTEPWMYPEILPEVKFAMNLREELLPFLYHLFFLAHRDSLPIASPLVWESVNEKTLQYSDQFYLGERLLVCPVTEKSCREISIYLPPAKSGWWNYLDSQWYEGDQLINLPVKASSIFLFVRGNTVLPLHKNGKLEMQIFASPSSDEEVFEFFTDDGESFAYKKGHCFHLLGKIRSENGESTLSVSNRGTEKRELQFSSFKSLKINGKQYSGAITLQL